MTSAIPPSKPEKQAPLSITENPEGLSFYKERIRDFTQRIQKVQGQIQLVAFFRLLAFASLAITVYYIFQERTLGRWLLAAALFLVFVALVRLSLWLKDQRARWEQFLFVNENEAGTLQYKPNQFDDGKALSGKESYLEDLDIFGRASLYHLLNRTTTSYGRDRLAGMLRQPLRTVADIEDDQRAIQTITPQVELRQLLTVQGLLNPGKEGDLYSLNDWLSTPPKLIGQGWLKIMRWVMVVYNLGAVYYFLDTNDIKPVLIGSAICWGIIGRFSKYINAQHALTGKKQAVLNQYAAILETFCKVEPGDSARLKGWKAQAQDAFQAVKQLSKLTGRLDQRMNMLILMFGNSLFMYDIHCMIALEKWKKQYKDRFNDWIDLVGNIESLNSLATFAANHPGYAYPGISASDGAAPADKAPMKGHLFIEAQGMAHPLIPASHRVTNDFTVGREDRLILVTGSNMSGKTTFLRTIGVNLLLAQAGAPVCAASFHFTPVQLLTSLRINDSLQEQTSYFMAELKKLQAIVRQLQTGMPSLVLIDEILRGTNSEDKTYGSEHFILKLLRYNCLSLFATHDLSLGQMEEQYPGVIRNYCFESVIEGGELHFNYQLQQGIARNRNASFLMKKMEII